LGFVEKIIYEEVTSDAQGGRIRVGKLSLFIPLAQRVDVAAERKKIEEELNYTQGFLASVEKKLSNERFVANAPEKVIALERKKAEDAQAKIKVLQENLAALNGE
jgi:valyl-tRNA synthetase